MLKYYNCMVVFEEIPDEISLAVNITNCPHRCIGCHSKFLWEDIGNKLTTEEIDLLIGKNKGITCIVFMGGDREPTYIDKLAKYIKEKYKNIIKVGWYSGNDEFSSEINLENFDYVKIGHFDEKLGGLNKKTTNQKLFKIEENERKIDITYKFWKENGIC